METRIVGSLRTKPRWQPNMKSSYCNIIFDSVTVLDLTQLLVRLDSPHSHRFSTYLGQTTTVPFIHTKPLSPMWSKLTPLQKVSGSHCTAIQSPSCPCLPCVYQRGLIHLRAPRRQRYPLNHRRSPQIAFNIVPNPSNIQPQIPDRVRLYASGVQLVLSRLRFSVYHCWRRLTYK